MARQLELIAKPARPRIHRAHVVDAGNCDGPGHCAEFLCSRCGWRSDWMRVETVTAAKRGIPCPNCIASATADEGGE